MKAIVCKKYGPTDQLKAEEITKPSPMENEVLVKIHFSAINDYDWSMVRGKPGIYRLFLGLFKPKNPVAGMELSGVVEAKGKQVTQLEVSDAVYGDISDHGFGSFAEYISINENALIRKPESISFEDAAALSHAANLAWQGLVDIGGIQEGMKILINGAGGGVGTLALFIAKTYEAEVTGVDTGDKLSTMQDIGFDHVIDYKKVDFTKTDEKYDLVLDAKTNSPPKAYLNVLNSEGKYVSIGGSIKNLIQLLIARKIRKKPVFMVGLKANKDLDKIHELYKNGSLKVVVDGPYPLSKTPWALQYFGEGKHTGKVIISVQE